MNTKKSSETVKTLWANWLVCRQKHLTCSRLRLVRKKKTVHFSFNIERRLSRRRAECKTNAHTKMMMILWCIWRGLKFGLNQLEPIIPLKANKDFLRKLHANSIWKSNERTNAMEQPRRRSNRCQKVFAYKRETAAHLNKTSNGVLVKQIYTRICWVLLFLFFLSIEFVGAGAEFGDTLCFLTVFGLETGASYVALSRSNIHTFVKHWPEMCFCRRKWPQDAKRSHYTIW